MKIFKSVWVKIDKGIPTRQKVSPDNVWVMIVAK